MWQSTFPWNAATILALLFALHLISEKLHAHHLISDKLHAHHLISDKLDFHLVTCGTPHAHQAGKSSAAVPASQCL